jgi:hypothetical protein
MMRAAAPGRILLPLSRIATGGGGGSRIPGRRLFRFRISSMCGGTVVLDVVREEIFPKK